MTRRRAALMVVVLLTLALAAAIAAPLGRIGLTEAVSAGATADALRHRLAMESVVTLLPHWIRDDQRIRDDLDRYNQATLQFVVGGVAVQVLLQDDSAKLPVAALVRSRNEIWLDAALARLQTGSSRAPLRRVATPTHGLACLDDLFLAATDDDLFGKTTQSPGWSGVLTPLGETINLGRAAPDVVAAALSDLDPRVAEQVFKAWRRSDRTDLTPILATVSGPTAERLARRFAIGTTRYSLLVRTTLRDDVRRRYWVCTADEAPVVLVDWEVAP